MAKVLKKKVNVYPVRPIWVNKKDVRRPVMGVVMNVGDIYNALLASGRVDEVLNNGDTVPLTLSNYNIINGEAASVEEDDEDEDSKQGVGEVSVKTASVEEPTPKATPDTTAAKTATTTSAKTTATTTAKTTATATK